MAKKTNPSSERKPKKRKPLVSEEAINLVKLVKSGKEVEIDGEGRDVIRIFNGKEGVEVNVQQGPSTVMYPAEKSAQLKKAGLTIEEMVSAALRCHRREAAKFSDEPVE